MIELSRQDNAWEFNVKELYRLGVDFNEKIILAIRVNLYDNDGILENLCDVSIKIFSKNAEPLITVDKLVAKRPYPNKNIIAMCKKIGRRTSRKYVPIIFDSFEQFGQIEKFEIIWNIPAFANQSFTVDRYIITDYFITAEQPVQKGIYGLWTYEDSDSLKNGTDSVYDDFAVLMLTNSELELVAKKEGTFDFEDIKYSGLMETVLKHIVSAESAAGGHLQQSEALIAYYKTDVTLTDDQIVT